MVYITDEEGTVRKFACLTCIKGHRSSGCQHAERELMEIRKKGRPVSQCAHCRNLRKTKQVHIKCLCHKKSDVLSTPSPPPNGSPVTTIASPTTTISPQSTSPPSSEIEHSDLIQQQDLQIKNLLSNPCTRCDRSPSYCICTFENRSNQVDFGYLSSGSSDGTVTPPTTTTTTTVSSPLANFDLHHDIASSTMSQPPTTTSHPLRLVIPSSTNSNVSHHHHHHHHTDISPSTTYDSIHSSTTSSPYTTPNTGTNTPKASCTFSPQQHTIQSSPAGLQSIIPIHDPSDDLDSDTPVYKSEEQTIDQSAVLGELTNRTSEELMNQIYNEFSADTYHLSHPPVDFDTDDMDYQQVPSSSVSRRSSYQNQLTPTT